jgi:hypothetical protein
MCVEGGFFDVAANACRSGAHHGAPVWIGEAPPIVRVCCTLNRSGSIGDMFRGFLRPEVPRAVAARGFLLLGGAKSPNAFE